MSSSKIEICNLALATLGADAIRSLDENNKRSRMCDVFYNFTVNYLLSKFDWPFARKLVKLNEAVTDEVIPEGQYMYQLPSDCKTARDLYPRGSEDWWEIMGDKLYCKKASEEGVYLYYTASNIDVSKYTDTFVNLAALGISVRLCNPITQNQKLANSLFTQFNLERNEAWESDANIGNDYVPYDNNPNNDSFVNPDLAEVREWSAK